MSIVKKLKQAADKIKKQFAGRSPGKIVQACVNEYAAIDKQIADMEALLKDPKAKAADICKAFAKLGPSPDFAKRDAAQRKVMTQNIRKLVKDDDLVKKASKDWSKLSTDEKEKVARKIMAAQRDAFEPKISPPKFDTFNKPPYKKDGKTYILNGQYNHAKDGGTLSLNVDPHSKFGKNLRGALNVVTHEQGHRYQNEVVDKLNNGEIKPGDPLYRQAKIWQLNFKAYQDPSKGFNCYEGQPVERHSRMVGSAGAKGL